jgi:hypothetical protein
MSITATTSKLHWNYFLALEQDMEAVSRYIEFSDHNLEAKVYSIELAHLLFAAASEVDVVAKLVCNILDPNAPRGNIDDYRKVIKAKMPVLVSTQIFIPRYGLELTPWDNWKTEKNPDWWGSYNNVKHQRDQHFDQATLKNALNALAGLLALTFHFYRLSMPITVAPPVIAKETTRLLVPESTLFRLPDDHYYGNLLI